MKPAPLISVIIANYNGIDLLKPCLESVYRQSFRDFEVIVVDNASEDDSTEQIIKEFPDLKLFPLTENIGFTGGNIEGLRHALGDYILLLNNDVEADGKCLENLLNAMKTDPDTGICAPKIIEFGQEIIDSAGDGFSTSLRGFKRGEGLPSSLYSREEYIFGACAGAVLYRRAMIDEIGFFDKDFFLIYEDTDLNLRAQLAGWKTRYIPAAIVHHKVRSSIGRMSDMAVYYSLRNSEVARLKNIPFRLFIRCLPSYIIGGFLEFLFFAVKHGKLRLYFRAKIDVIKNMRSLKSRRKKIMRSVKVDSRYLYNMMTPICDRELFSDKIRKFFFK